MRQLQLVLRLSHRLCRTVHRVSVGFVRCIGGCPDQANWEAFFRGTTPAARKIALLQNWQEFAAIIQAQAASALAQSASATVTAMHVISATQATVTYDIYLGGKPALSNQTGTAVSQDGTWKVGDVSFCQLLALENGGKAPAVCSSVG